MLTNNPASRHTEQDLINHLTNDVGYAISSSKRPGYYWLQYPNSKQWVEMTKAQILQLAKMDTMSKNPHDGALSLGEHTQPHVRFDYPSASFGQHVNFQNPHRNPQWLIGSVLALAALYVYGRTR